MLAFPVLFETGGTHEIRSLLHYDNLALVRICTNQSVGSKLRGVMGRYVAGFTLDTTTLMKRAIV